MNKKVLFSSIALATVSLAGVGMYAHAQGNNLVSRAPWFNQSTADAIQNAINNGDYNAWKSAMTDQMNARMNYVFSKITPDNFSKYAEMRKDMMNGDFADAQKIRQELGFPGRGMGRGGMMGRHWNNQNTNANDSD